MAKKKILLVDDEKGFTDVLKLNLESCQKYVVEVENDPARALNSALRFRPDLILLDVIMPDKEGPDIVLEIKNNPILKDVPIVFLTATVTSDEVDAQKGVIGGHPFVAKPSTLGSLIECIEREILFSQE